MTISNLTLQELLPYSLTSHPCVSIDKDNHVWSGSTLLIHCLESFTDSLVVTDNGEPIGILGGKDLLAQLLQNPTSELFYDMTIQEVMFPQIDIISPKMKLSSLLSNWKESRRAFSIIPNKIGNYSGISARSIMEIGINVKTNIKSSDLPQKNVLTCSNDDTIRHVIDMMFEKNTRKILLKNSSKFISDRIILEKISRDLDHLKNCKNFFELKVSDFTLADAKIIKEDLLISKLSSIMLNSIHPYVVYQDNVISPWDVCLSLLDNDVTLNNRAN